MNTTIVKGSALRAAKRSFDPKFFTRNAAHKLITETTDIALIRRFAVEHANKHVMRHAVHRANRLENPSVEATSVEATSVETVELPVESIETPVLIEAPPIMTSPVDDELAALIARFTAEGKPDPRKSAKASLLAKAGAAKRAAAKAVAS